MIQMNVNFKAIEKAWGKPKKDVLYELEEWCNEESFYVYDCDKWVLDVEDILDKIQELKNEVK